GLMGPVDYFDYESMEGRKPNSHGIPRFRSVSFDAAYPFGQVHLSDRDLPVEVTLQAFNPLIPGDDKASGIPIAVLRYVVRNTTSKSVTVSVCGSMENFVGADGFESIRDWKGDFIPSGAKENRNEFRKGNGFQGIFMSSDGVDPEKEQWGTMALTTSHVGDVSYRTSVSQKGWGSDILDFWDDFDQDGILTESAFTGGDTPRASLAVKTVIEPGSNQEIEFYLTWHFPNRKAWGTDRVGNYYTTLYSDAWDVIRTSFPKLPALEKKTKEFVNAFIRSDLPEVVKEAALFNLSTLRTQTCFRTEDGRFYGWEGCMDNSGCCLGSCTHVWNYEQATAHLFGKLALSMREVEFGHATDDTGLMSFRVSLPIKNAQERKSAAADGQMGCIMKMYRDWQLSGNLSMLKALWPNVKKALEFCWIQGGWDADSDGVMEGCQHNTMDVEYYGPNPQMQIWYLGALRAAEEMALHLEDRVFAKKCSDLFARGSKWTDAHLFNGEYYIHLVQPPEKPEDVNPVLRVGMGAKDLLDPDFQLAEGCLVDQLVGQYTAHVLGLGYLVEEENVKKTLQSILKYNQKTSFHDHFNNMRSYVLGEEAGLLMASFPHKRPRNPFPYFNEVMTGFEYCAAVGMLYEGLEEEGLQCFVNIRNRYDGRKRSPFDEAECGHHYARAMASWAGVLALTGFHYSAVERKMELKHTNGKHFWSNGYAYGTVKIEQKREGAAVELMVLNGNLDLKSFKLAGYGDINFERPISLGEGQTESFLISGKNVQ
ncbi:GH116 family glycosyl-hydrolase, partial [Acidobacteriota bacterium]